MRTLKGYEAIELAERYDILLYKFTTQSEVTAAEARGDIEARGNAAAYVIEAWPESEEEAEQIIIKAIDHELRNSRSPAVTFEHLMGHLNANGEKFIHPMAMELAIERLIEKDSLAIDKNTNGEPVYVLTRTLAFTEDFLTRLRGVVCEECADLSWDTPFHESCLLDLFDFLHTYKLTLEDLERAVDTPRTKARRQFIDKSSTSMQWLSKTVSETRSRWKTVLQPIIKNRLTNKLSDQSDTSDDNSTTEHTTESAAQSETGQSHSEPPLDANAAMAVAVTAETNNRPKITKNDLIQYLRSVEVLDEGELDKLQEEREKLLRELEQREHEIQQLRHQKTQLESQYADLQQDMDVLVRAMRIANQHDSTAPTEIITAYETDGQA